MENRIINTEKIDIRIRVLVKAILATWAGSRICGLQTTNIMTVVAFVFFLYAFRRITEREKIEGESRLQRNVERLLSGLLTTFYIAGDFEKIYAGLDNMLFRVGIVLVTALGLYVMLRMCMSLVVILTQCWQVTATEPISKHMPILAAGICFLCWIPYLLKNYPGIMTIDSMNQFAQVIGVYADSNHHPWVHTQVMKLLYQIGLWVTGDRSLAISFYTIFQMCFLSLCIAYLTQTLMRLSVKKWILGLIIAFYALVPYHALYAVTIWKDSMFAGGVLLYSASLLRLIQQDKQKKTDLMMSVISGIMMCLFRTNGWYAFLVTIPFVVLVLRTQWKLILSLQLLVVAVVLVIKGPVMSANHVIQPDLVESLSIPAQQISRVIVQKKELTQEQDAFLNQILDTSAIAELYNPYVSDGFKRLVRAGNEPYLEEHFGEFMKVYLQIGCRYPVDYLIAFRDQSIGYWFPSQEGIIAGDEAVIPNEFGVVNMPILKGNIVIKLNEIALKLKDMIPLYGILWSMGALLWMIIVAMGILLIRGKKEYLLLYVPCIAIFLTLVIATPVAKEFRYAYAYIYCMPIYLIMPFIKQSVNPERRNASRTVSLDKK